MLILIGLVPAHYALNPEFGHAEIRRTVSAADNLLAAIKSPALDAMSNGDVAALAELSEKLTHVRQTLDSQPSFRAIPTSTRWRVRSDILLVGKALKKLEHDKALQLTGAARDVFRKSLGDLNAAAEFAPTWVLIAVALSLGLGTTVGWKRIVETVGEKIGKSHLSYAQGSSAEIVAMSTIALADFGGLPVSTTQVLSSGIAGTMAANRSGLQFKTIRNIALAWVLTLPVSMLLAGGLFLLFRFVAH